MRKNHIVKKGVFVVIVAHSWTFPAHYARFKSYENAYSFLRYRCSCLGWTWGALYYHPYSSEAFILLALVDKEGELL